MKLELKHLDFVNNGIVKLSRQPHWVFDNVKLQDCQLSFSSTINEPYLRYRDVTFSMDQIIPYKRPISDLTKEIEVNGEKFIPIMVLFGGENYREYDFVIDVVEKPILGKRIEISVKDLGAPCIIFGLKNPNYNTLTLNNWQLLYEWHFDIFGLIDNGLAIDINTLK